MSILILGSTGLVGYSLQTYFKKNRIAFFTDTRNQNHSNIQKFYFDIYNYKSFKIDNRIKSIIYVSHIKKLEKENIKIQLMALNFVLKLAKKSNVKLIFISSQSTLNSSLSRYGKLKLDQSKSVINNNELSISMGLLISDIQSGFFYLLKKYLLNKFIVLKIYPDTPLETCTTKILGDSILMAIKNNTRGNYYIYNEDIRSFNELVDKYNFNRNKLIICIPKVFIKYLFIILNKMFKNSDFIESILSFINLKKFTSNKKFKSFSKFF